ncbi:MAG: hypothetical protein PHG21_12130 [Azoarcus sp.]|nr:hypothetical protein [Azoarcus sp.]
MSPDTARFVAFDPTAPSEERNDVLAELQKSHIPSNALMPETLVLIFEMAEYSPMNKAINKNVVPFPGRFQGKSGMQSVGLDEWQLGPRTGSRPLLPLACKHLSDEHTSVSCR